MPIKPYDGLCAWRWGNRAPNPPRGRRLDGSRQGLLCLVIRSACQLALTCAHIFLQPAGWHSVSKSQSANHRQRSVGGHAECSASVEEWLRHNRPIQRNLEEAGVCNRLDEGALVQNVPKPRTMSVTSVFLTKKISHLRLLGCG